ncbi:MAG: hypothetical protein IPM49_06085 [Flavobacteriales bacterium]|nr:hypothetical protein [Flavobacteriales bacterium]
MDSAQVSKIFELNSAISDWLFVSGFWERLNKRMGERFDHFEHAEVAISELPIVRDEIAIAQDDLRNKDTSFQFVRAQIPDGSHVYEHINRDEAIERLKSWDDFLFSAERTGLLVDFEL